MVTLAGTVETFDAADFTVHLAASVGVEPAAITLSVAAASVRVAATIRVVGEAVGVIASVQALANDASTLSLALGVTVESVGAPTVSVRAGAAPSPPPASPPPPSPSPSPPPPSPPPPSPPTSTPCTSFDGVVWSDEFTKWVGALFQMADADGSGTVNDRDELAMLLSFLNLKPSEACADKLNQLLKQSLAGISFSDFFKWLKVCLPARHVWRDCPPSAPPPSPPPCGKYVTAEGGVAFSHHCPPPPPPSSPPPYCATLLDFVLVLDESGSMYNVMEGVGGLKAFAKELVRH